ncbi:MAG TPA: STAS domain-containing protein [Bryobacteraceae bacterium]|nr:STAS domain-containing protein [Bryobacteraceae bacterium]
MADHLEIKQRELEGIRILDLKGRITLGPEDLELRERLLSFLTAGTRNIILNFKDVHDIDTTGIGSLVHCATKYEKAGGRIAFLNLAPVHAHIPEILKLDAEFPAYQNELDAVNSFFPERVVPHYDLLEFIEHLEAEKKDHLV